MTQRAFTLMEVLLTTVLVSMVGVCIFQAFNNSLKLWSRGQAIDLHGQTAIMMDKMGEDLRSTAVISGVKFSGSGMRVSFPALVITPADRSSSRISEGLVDTIGAVEYRFDPADGKIYRRQANYGQALKGQWGQELAVAEGIEDMELRYYYSTAQGAEVKSLAEKIPAGVMVQVRLKGDQVYSWVKRFFMVPVAG